MCGSSLSLGASAGLLGAAASTPAFGQGSVAASGTSAFGLGSGQSSSAPFTFGASGAASLGPQSNGADFGAGATSESDQSAAAASSAPGFRFGRSGALTFGAESSAASGGSGAAAPAFGAQPLSTGDYESCLDVTPECLLFCCVLVSMKLRNLSCTHAACCLSGCSLQD